MSAERIVGAAVDDETLTRTGRSLGDLASEHVANAALDAVRNAIASGDPAVVQAMAERIGLTVESFRTCSACAGGYDHPGACDSRSSWSYVIGERREAPYADA